MNSIQALGRHLCRTLSRHAKSTHKRNISTLSDESRRQSELFDLEKKRQNEAVGRIEKIEVHYEGALESASFMMNKGLSTPYDCAKHLGEKFVNRSAVALLNGDTLWHMHKPLPDACKLEFLHYNIAQPASVNKAFWRTCSFMLGAVVQNSFKDNIKICLHSFPSPNVRSGSFVYDVQLLLDDWKPTQNELRVLSIDMIKLAQQNLNIECLDVDTELALLMFKSNPHKTQQIPDIAMQNNGKVTLFKVGHHIDISRGPMVTNSNHLGRITIANVHKLETDVQGGPLYRFQGVALPSCLIINHFAYGLLEERARKLNSARIPGTYDGASDDNNFVAQAAV